MRVTSQFCTDLISMQFTMKFLPVAILFLCLGRNAVAQVSYKDLPISWSDFTLTDQIRVNAHGTAAISVHTEYSWESSVRNNKVAYIDFKSKLTVNRKESFVLRSFMRTANAERKARLLRHEQGHYLIGLIKHLWLEQAISEYRFTRNYKEEIRKICKQVEDRAAKLNNDYDRETEHSLIEDKQLGWEQRLLDTFNKLNDNKTKLPLQFDLKLTVNL